MLEIGQHYHNKDYDESYEIISETLIDSDGWRSVLVITRPIKMSVSYIFEIVGELYILEECELITD